MFRGRDTSPLYFELLVSTDLNKPIAPIIMLYPIAEREGLLGLSPPVGYLYKPWDYQTTEWYSLA
jgi:hypothetical protein